MRLHVFCLLLLMMLMGCRQSSVSTTHRSSPVDTAYTDSAALAVFDYHPDRALTIIDSAVIVGNLTEERASFLRAKILSQSYKAQRLDSAQAICECLLADKAVAADDDMRQDVLELLCNIARMRCDYGPWLKWASQLVELCRSRGCEAEMMRNQAEIGVIHASLGLVSTGLAEIDSVISRLDGIRHFNELDASVIAMKRKINVLCDVGRYADEIDVAHRLIERLDDYEKFPDAYHDGTYREPADATERGKYINFYRAQAHGFMAEAFAASGDERQARRQLALFEASDYGRTLSGRAMIANTLCRLHEWDKLLATCDDVTRALGDDTLRRDYANVVRYRALVAEGHGQYSAASAAWKRYIAIDEVLNDSLRRSQTQMYAARFHFHEQRRELDRKTADARRGRIMAWAGALIALLAVGFALWSSRQRRLLRQKNRVLIDKINDALDYREKYQALSDMQVGSDDAGHTTSPDAAMIGAMSRSEVDALTDEQLFALLSRAIVDDRLFLDPACDRQMLMERYGLTKERIGAAFSRGSEHNSLASYIRDLRLEYAFRMLADNPDYTINQVAKECGFFSADTFRRGFKDKFGISPTEYRQACQSSSPNAKIG